MEITSAVAGATSRLCSAFARDTILSQVHWRAADDPLPSLGLEVVPDSETPLRSSLESTATPRLRLAVLLDHLNAFSGGYEAQLRDAIHAKCREAGHDVLLIYGGPVDPPRPMDAADNAIYELLSPDSVDGIIVISTLLSTYCGPAGVARLVEGFGHPTTCSVGIELPGVPSLVLDNRPGMEAVVEHLVRDHGRR